MSNEFSVITTFSRDGYHLYGQRMIRAWLKHWPKNSRLTVYTEGYKLLETSDRIDEIDINESCPNLEKFKQASWQLDQPKEKIEKTIKWCHKVYAIQHALKNQKNYLIFLDGDTYTKNNVPEDFPKKLVVDNLFAVHFENLKHGLHFETGLIVFNLKHEKIKWLIEILTTAYDSLDIYNMKKTWDGFWFSHLYEKYNLPVVNLSGNRQGVFCNPLVKELLVHDVGTQKYLKAGYNKFTGRKE
jgi:hypothetical protein